MAGQVSSARAFFDQVVGFADANEAFAFLSDIPDRPDPFFEEEWLDFKGRARDEGDEKKIWSKALSGYANMTDGVIVWGIDARKDPATGIDAAGSLKLIPDAHALESRLRDWIRDATNPPVMGVEFKCYPGSKGEGFVVCFIPESAHKPHRAEWAQKQYYYRAVDDFLPAEPAMLRHLFYPRYSADFRIEVSLEHGNLAMISNPDIPLTLKAVIQNIGNATARDVYAKVDTTAPVNKDAWVVPYHDFWMSTSGIPSAGMIAARYPLHPEFRVQMWTSVAWEARARAQGGYFVPGFNRFTVALHVYCLDSEYRYYTVDFSQADSFDNGCCIKTCNCIM
jgi:hypothetical protein